MTAAGLRFQMLPGLQRVVDNHGGARRNQSVVQSDSNPDFTADPFRKFTLSKYFAVS